MNKLLKSPDFFLYSLFFFVIAWYEIFKNDFIPLSDDLIIDISLFLFVFFLVFRYFSFILSVFLHKIEHVSVSRFIPVVFFNYLSFFLFMYVLINFFINLYSSNFDFRLLREGVAGLDGDKISTGVGVAFPVILASYYISKLQSELYKSNVFLFMLLTVAIVSSSKIFLIIFIIYFYHVSELKINIKFIFIFLFSSLSLFSISTVLLGKFANDGDGSVLLAIINTLNVYLLGGIGAFQMILYGEVPNNEGWMKVGDYFTNVYSAFYSFYLVFYEFYFFYSAVIIGLFYSLFYVKIKLVNQFFGFYKIFLFYPLFMVIFSNEFLSWKMHLIYFSISIVLGLVRIEVCNRELKYVSNNSKI